MEQKHNIMWWNLENLFEIETDPERPNWLQNTLKSELKGWDEAVLGQKIKNLSTIIKKIDNGRGPDILACCEIENERVLARLIAALKLKNRNYQVIHKDTRDSRGIDIAFIYDANKYDFTGPLFSLEVMKRNATRDLVQITLTTKVLGHELVLIGAHFPARVGGQFESEPFRIMVAETLSYWVSRTIDIKKAANPNTSVSIMVVGDFNDEPHHRSMTDYAMSTPTLARINNARGTDYLYNPMWNLRGDGDHSYVFGGEKMMLDQALFSKDIAVKGTPFQIKDVRIVKFAGMTTGDYEEPVRFSRPSKGDEFNPNGFSDHLPVLTILTELP